MRTLGRWLLAILVVVGLGAALVFADQSVRRDAESRVSTAIADQFGGEVTTELGGWPFMFSQIVDKITDARILVTGATVPVGDQQAELSRVELWVVNVEPASELSLARAERLDAQVTVDWEQLTLLAGFPIVHAGDDRIAGKLGIEILGVVGVAELEARLSVEADGTLVLSEPSATAAGVPIPDDVVGFALDKFAPQFKLPEIKGLAYEGLDITDAGITARLHGTDVALYGLR